MSSNSGNPVYQITRLRSESESQYVQCHESRGPLGQNDQGKVVVVRDRSGKNSSVLMVRKELETVRQ